jgi:hypothetical protein
MNTINLNGLQELGQFLHGPGIRDMIGCDPERVEQMIALANERFPEKGVCVVAHWIYAEIEISEQDREALAQEGIQPVMIYGGKVIRDQRRPYGVGGWIRSTPMKSFSEGCLFESQNTIYLLQGSGVVKPVKIDVIMAIQ